MVEAYAPWRRWYRRHVPVRIEVDASRMTDGLAERALQAVRLEQGTLSAKRDGGTVVILVNLTPKAVEVFDRHEREMRTFLDTYGVPRWESSPVVDHATASLPKGVRR